MVNFYHQAGRDRLDVWSQWSPLMWPGGWMISTIFATQLQKFSLPLRPLDVAFGIDSDVIADDDQGGHQIGAAWLRRVRVVFSLPNGSARAWRRRRVVEHGDGSCTSWSSRRSSRRRCPKRAHQTRQAGQLSVVVRSATRSIRTMSAADGTTLPEA